MERELGKDLEQGKKRVAFLMDNCDAVEEKGYMKPFTPEELAELENARKMPITFDEDCPETTPERAIKFKRVNPPRKTADAQ